MKGGAEGLWRALRAEGTSLVRPTADFPPQDESTEKKPKRREKLKRRGKAEGEQAQLEESGLGDGDLQPPLPKKAKKRQKSNGVAEESGTMGLGKSSSALSDGEAAQSASNDVVDGEHDGDSEVVTARRALVSPSRCPGGNGLA